MSSNRCLFKVFVLDRKGITFKNKKNHLNFLIINANKINYVNRHHWSDTYISEVT